MTKQEHSDIEKEKIIEAVEAIKKQYNIGSESLASDIYMDSEAAKLIDCRHEILIKVTAHVIEQDAIGNTVGTKEVCQKNYHIPVPEHKDHNVYLSGFFDFLEGCMSQSVESQTEE
jgi:hypothetical protein